MVARHPLWNEHRLDALRTGLNSESHLPIEVVGEKLVLFPDGSVYWPEPASLWLSDLHLGKAAHFRKHGVPIGSDATLATLNRLRERLKSVRPVSVYLLGDLFHSDLNREWEPFAGLCEEFSSLEWTLVRGNHDLIPPVLLEESGIALVERLDTGPFTFTHDPSDFDASFKYHVCGHIHPGIRLVGSGRQALRLRCFHFNQTQGVLPAYGSFTGMHLISPKSRDQVFALTDRAVIQV